MTSRGHARDYREMTSRAMCLAISRHAARGVLSGEGLTYVLVVGVASVEDALSWLELGFGLLDRHHDLPAFSGHLSCG